MKRQIRLLVLCVVLTMIAATVHAEVGRLEANVAPSEAGGTFICIATLVMIPSHEKVVVETLEVKAGEKSEKVWGEESSSGSGFEYRLTCTVDSDGTSADVLLKKTRNENGKAAGVTQYAAKVAIK
ncbi:MAG: hypothetical protein ACSLFQ_10505 [Thermoanaerobaculia bacterium]